MKPQWSDLSTVERFQIALEVARRRGHALVKAIDNVVSVGAGFRLRGSENDLVDEVCLCFLVRRKWADRRMRAQKIPEFVAAYTNVHGKRIRVLIPTDVSEFKGGEPHSALNLTSGITSRSGGSPMDLGSACCLVRNAAFPSERYLLSCYHVFSKTLDRPPQSGIDCIAGGALIGSAIDAASAIGSAALDAALVRVDDPSITEMSVWGLAPSQRATDFDIAQLAGRGQLFVLGRQVAPAVGGLPEEVRSDPIPAFLRALIPVPTEYDYRATAGRTFVFSDTIEYKAAVRPGDSGAALVDTQGMVYGMHFFGRDGFGYSLSAPRLFDPGAFSLDIAL